MSAIDLLLSAPLGPGQALLLWLEGRVGGVLELVERSTPLHLETVIRPVQAIKLEIDDCALSGQRSVGRDIARHCGVGLFVVDLDAPVDEVVEVETLSVLGTVRISSLNGGGELLQEDLVRGRLRNLPRERQCVDDRGFEHAVGAIGN